MANQNQNQNVVKNDSKGYGYNYASLSDIAKQGYKIPRMKVINNENTDYVYYFDEELKEWEQGARVVLPSNIGKETKGMNEAQLYGSALTYARRYTTLMALGLACDDDKKIEELGSELKKAQQNISLKKALSETAQKNPQGFPSNEPSTLTINEVQFELLKQRFTTEQLKNLQKMYKIKSFSQMPLEIYNQIMEETTAKEFY